MICNQNLGIKDGVWEKVKSRLGSFTNLLRICEKDFIGVSYVFLLIIVGNRILSDFLGFCISIFPILRALLSEVVGVVLFCVSG